MVATDAQASYTHTLIDEFARLGVRHAFVAPGSRNTPLSLALVAHPDVEVHVVVDERVAAYAALGVGRATGVPAIVSCTSGTAAVNFHPAVVEASFGYVPLIVCTADRPARLRGTGANQTIDQVRLYGDAVRAFSDVEAFAPLVNVARLEARSHFIATSAPLPGPVHLNLQFDDPLVPSGPVEVGAAYDVPASFPPVASRVVQLPEARRPIVVAGWGADVASVPDDWPVLADPLSGLRHGPYAVSTYEALLRIPGFVADHTPDLIVRVGSLPTGKGLFPWLDSEIPQILVVPDARGADPFGRIREAIVAPGAVLESTGSPDAAWCEEWRVAEFATRAAIDATLDGFTSPFDGRVLRDVVATAPSDSLVVVGSSMPIRDLEYFMAPRADIRLTSNRGASGIDGVMATAFGAALAGNGGPTTVVLGDLSFLHDTNALLLANAGVDAVVVVLDNDGGGIFEFLPPRTAVPEQFELLFGTPHGLDLTAVAHAHGVAATRVDDPDAVGPAVAAGHAAGGLQVVVVPSDRAENRLRHAQVWDAVAARD